MVSSVRAWMGEDGIAFFTECVRDHGTVSPTIYLDVKMDDGEVITVPHSVHFNEGMQVRNHLRRSGLCHGWNDHDYDDEWAAVVRLAIYEPQQIEGVEPLREWD